MSTVSAGVDIRPYHDEDEQAVLSLLNDALGGGPAGTRPAEFFRWKHVENPFGRSFMLVAEVDGRIVGLRAFMRWEFVVSDRRYRAVRAVDTATHPDHQGKGIFSRLTLEALDSLRDQADFVFNTPNEKSLPGYMKMGWQIVGRVPIWIRVRRPIRFASRARSWRSASELGEIPPVGAAPAAELLDERIDDLLVEVERPLGFATPRDGTYLRWRYGAAPILDYRALTTPGGRGDVDGLAVFRVRPRGGLAEATLAETIVRPGGRRAAAKLLRDVGASARVDHVAFGFPPGSSADMVARRLGIRPRARRRDPSREPARSRPRPRSSGPAFVGVDRGRSGGLLMRARRTLEASAPPALVASIGLVLIGAYVSVTLITIDRTSFDVWGAMLLAPVLLVLSVPLLRRQATREDDPALFRLLLFALALKLIGSVIRYYVAFSVYGGGADATRYHDAGLVLAEPFRHLDLSNFRFDTGTPFMEVVTGVVYAIIGPTKLGGFLFFSWLGFWGLFFCYRAFAIGVPEGRRRSYAYLLFFMPSLLFWPSGIGKEAWMMFGLGIAAYGIAKILAHDMWRGLVACGLGLWLAGMIRPHMAGLVGVSLVAAVITARSRRDLGELTPIVKGGTIVVVAILAAVLVVRTDRFLQESGIDTSEGVNTTLTDVESRTGEGGSEFVPSILDSPLRAPVAVVTVLFRPFIAEAHNLQSLLAAVEGTTLFLLCLWRARWIWAAVRSLRRQPYVVFCLVFSVVFIVAYSSYANFGLLARQRVQLYPLFLVLISIPPVTGRDRGSLSYISPADQEREAVPV